MRISIITATLNSGKFLKECIASVLRQQTGEIQHILVDGGSSDDTLQIAAAYPHLDVTVRPGCTIYEAWNIGLELATGDLIGFCNSDDYYALRAFERISQTAAAHPDAVLVSGKAVQIARDASGNDVILAEYSDKVQNRLCFEDLNVFGPAPNARFFSKSLIARIGKFDTRFRLCADCSYLMQIALLRLPVANVQEIVYYYRSHPASTTLGGNIDALMTTLDEKLMIGNEFINKKRLELAELHHLRRAMASQCSFTFIENLRRAEWRSTAEVVSRLRLLGLSGLVLFLAETSRIVCRHMVERLLRRVRAIGLR